LKLGSRILKFDFWLTVSSVKYAVLRSYTSLDTIKSQSDYLTAAFLKMHRAVVISKIPNAFPFLHPSLIYLSSP